MVRFAALKEGICLWTPNAVTDDTTSCRETRTVQTPENIIILKSNFEMKQFDKFALKMILSTEKG